MPYDEEAGGEPPCLMGFLDEHGRVPDRPTGAAARVQTKRIYEPASVSDGYRVLVDRLWPRGVSKQAARIDHWLRAVAPSDALRRWFGHDPARWEEFCRRYRAELETPEGREAVREVVGHAERGPLTLVHGARDAERNNAVVLRAVLLDALGQEEA